MASKEIRKNPCKQEGHGEREGKAVAGTAGEKRFAKLWLEPGVLQEGATAPKGMLPPLKEG